MFLAHDELYTCRTGLVLPELSVMWVSLQQIQECCIACAIAAVDETDSEPAGAQELRVASPGPLTMD